MSSRLSCCRCLLLAWLVLLFGIAPQSGFGQSTADKPSQDSNEKENFNSLTGRVMLSNKSPAIGAKVYLLKSSSEYYTLPTHPMVAVADEQGNYRFTDVAPSAYRVWAETDRETSLEAKLQGTKITIPARPAQADPVDLELFSGFGFLVNVVRKDNGQPIVGAKISFGWTDIEREYTTDTQGRVEVGGLAADEWYMVIHAPDYAISYRKFPRQRAGTKLGVKFELDRGAILRGVIVDENMKPVANATVGLTEKIAAMSPGLGRAKTDAAGAFQLGSLPIATPMRFSSSADGYEHLMTELAIPEDQPVFVKEFLLKSVPYGGDCLVTVVDKVGNPIPDAKVENQGSSSSNVRRAVADASGVAKLENLFKSHQGKTAVVSASGYITQRVDLHAGSREEPGQTKVTMVPGDTIRGRLLRPSGEPAAKIRVYYNGAESAFPLGGRVDTDEDGRFRIDGLPKPSTFTFYTPAPYAPIKDRELPVGEKEEVVVTMEMEGVIKIRAIDAGTRQLIPEYVVQIAFPKDRRPNDPIVSFRSDLMNPGVEVVGAVKEFRLGQLHIGTPFQVTILSKGYIKKVLPRVEASEENTTDPFVMLDPEDRPKTRMVAGKIVDSKGNPVSGAVLRLIVTNSGAADGNYRNWYSIQSNQIEQDSNCVQYLQTTTNRDGTFRFNSVLYGKWMQLVHTGGDVANGVHRYFPTQSDGDIGAWEIRTPIGGSIRVRIDPREHSGVEHISISPNSGMPFAHYSAAIENPGKELTVDKLPLGDYTVTIEGKRIDLGRGAFQSNPIASKKITVRDGESLLVSMGAE